MFKQHEPCPRCGSRDNLGRWADGSAWCFGCHYYERADGRAFDPTAKVEVKKKDYSDPPDDIGMDFSEKAKAWLDQYGLTLQELYERKVRFSPSKNQIIFILDQGVWQARNLSPESKHKYFTQGNVNDHLGIYNALRSAVSNVDLMDSSHVCLVEDCVSAIKVGRQIDAMPLLGSNISYQKLARIAKLYKGVVFWLDADKYKEAQGLSTRAKMLGLDSRVIYTPKDPKEYSDKFIKDRLLWENSF